MKINYCISPRKDALLLCFNTYPKFDNNNFIKNIDDNFKKARENRIEIFSVDKSFDYENYYQPIHFHLWSSWDICSLVRIDSSYQITKIFNPIQSDSLTSIANTSTKLLSGISFENFGLPLNEINNKINGNYLAITNLKLSNKWLLKNGYKLIESLLIKINKDLNNVKYTIFQSYSAYEITLIIFGDKLTKLAHYSFKIRETLINELEDFEEFKILYGEEDFHSNVFSDSNTIFGVRYQAYNNQYKLTTPGKEKIKVYYEFEVKPCQHNFISNKLNEIIGEKCMIKPGKYDVISPIVQKNINEFNISNLIRQENEKEAIKDSIRKLKTNLIFESVKSNTKKAKINFNTYFYDINFEKINNDLKKLKVSKTIRNQILRVFYSFKNQLSDTINLNLFLDLLFFINTLQDEISKRAEFIDKVFRLEKEEDISHKINVQELENKLKEFIKVFSDSYLLRYTNDHSFNEDLPDFLISHNAQYQSLASLYDNLTKQIASLVLGEEIGGRIMTTFDDSITINNVINLKLSTYLLFEPNLVFSLVFKEVLNIYIANEFPFIKLRDNYFKEKINKYYIEYPECPTKIFQYNMIDHSILEYLYNDYMRLKLFYKNDFKLFYYSYLSNLIQLPAIYSATGGIDKNKLIKEAFRIHLLVYFSSNYDYKDVEYVSKNPPNIEVASDWFFINSHISTFLKSSFIEKTIKDENIIKRDLIKIDESIKKISKAKNFKSLIIPKINFIKKVYSSDALTPSFIGRNWKDGKIMKEYFHMKSKNSKPYFLYDPQGGIFFYNFKRMEEYSKIKNEMMMCLYQESCIYKSEIFKKIENEYAKI